MMRKTVQILGTWFGLGYAPFAPGTVGTLGALPLVWWFSRLGIYPYMTLTFLLTVAAIVVAEIYEHEVAENHDASEFVFDEVVGFLVTMTWVPISWPYLGLGFLLFRALDALKPFPISWVDRKVKGGFGVVADDLVAGIIANVMLQLILQHGGLGWGLTQNF